MGERNAGVLLHEAVASNDIDGIEWALKAGADLETTWEDGNRPLTLAVVYKFDGVVERLISAGASVGATDDGESPLTLAARSTGPDELDAVDERMVALLLGAGADVRHANRYGCTALGGCGRGTSESTVRIAAMLLTRGALPDDPDAQCGTPLIDASASGCLPMVRLLLDYGADPNRPHPESVDAPLNAARRSERPEVQRLLLAAGALEPAAVQTDLITAVVWGDAEAVARLAPGHPGVSPLLYDALWYGDRPAVVAALLDHGADPDHRSGGEGEISALESAVDLKRSETVEVLLSRGADPFLYGREGAMMASAGDNGDERTLATLLRAGVSLDAAASEGTTALMQAAHQGHLKIVRFLIDHGANVNLRTLNIHPDYYGGSSALMDAVKRKDSLIEVARALLDAGADVDAPDAAGNTPLMWAAWWGVASVLRLLLEHGADANAVNLRGQTVLDWADREGNAEKVTLLIEAGAERGTYSPRNASYISRRLEGDG